VITYRRSAGVSETAVDADLYLVAPGSQDIFHLDSMAAGLWRLLQAPATEAALIAIMADAFPEVDAAEIAADVTRSLALLCSQGLIEVSGSPGA
jgi:hypothetical protein